MILIILGDNTLLWFALCSSTEGEGGITLRSRFSLANAIIVFVMTQTLFAWDIALIIVQTPNDSFSFFRNYISNSIELDSKNLEHQGTINFFLKNFEF